MLARLAWVHLHRPRSLRGALAGGSPGPRQPRPRYWINDPRIDFDGSRERPTTRSSSLQRGLRQPRPKREMRLQLTRDRLPPDALRAFKTSWTIWLWPLRDRRFRRSLRGLSLRRDRSTDGLWRP